MKIHIAEKLISNELFLDKMGHIKKCFYNIDVADVGTLLWAEIFLPG